MHPLTTVSLAVVLLIAGGCGKPSRERQQEKELDAQINALHDSTMTLMPALKTLLAKLPVISTAVEQRTATASSVTLNALVGDLKTAHEDLVKAQSSMQSWMKAHKRYDEDVPHDAVMAGLSREKEELTTMHAALVTAISKGNAACDAATQTLAAAPQPHKGRK
jgi:hypothetical protein